MPLQKCTKNGQSGWRWGQSGACYTGPDGKKKAIRQALAIGNGKMPQEAKASLSDEDLKILENEEQLYSQLTNSQKFLLQLEAQVCQQREEN